MKANLFLLTAVAALALGACASAPAPAGSYAVSGRAPPPGCTSAACTQQSNTIAANWYSGA